MELFLHQGLYSFSTSFFFWGCLGGIQEKEKKQKQVAKITLSFTDMRTVFQINGREFSFSSVVNILRKSHTRRQPENKAKGLANGIYSWLKWFFTQWLVLSVVPTCYFQELICHIGKYIIPFKLWYFTHISHFSYLIPIALKVLMNRWPPVVETQLIGRC